MASFAAYRRLINRNLLADPVVAEALAPQRIEQHCRDAGHRWRDSFWSPSITLYTFLLQVLDPNKTLRGAVANLLTQLAARHRPPPASASQADAARALPSPDPSAYCQARQRLPGEALTRLLHLLAERSRAQASAAAGWLGRRVWVTDGSSASMPDTPELQEAFEQPSGQAPGCGFPVMSFVALFCWTTGAIVDVVLGRLTHDLSLFRRLWHHFLPGDVVLGDRAFCSYVDFARLLQRGVYCVCRLHQRRTCDFRAGRRLGHDDRLVTWQRPTRWLESFGIRPAEFAALPKTLTVRLVRITHVPRGFRSRPITVVTTLTDPIETPADAIRALYRDRWTAELNFRSLKGALGMDVLRGESVDVVLKEIVMHLVAYNLIRLLMWHAARRAGVDLHRLSFAGTLQRLQYAAPWLLMGGGTASATLLDLMLEWIASDRVPHRPNRYEPRRVKRRPKPYSRLNRPRAWFRMCHDHSAR
jgi:hypothetical protein